MNMNWIYLSLIIIFATTTLSAQTSDTSIVAGETIVTFFANSTADSLLKVGSSQVEY